MKLQEGSCCVVGTSSDFAGVRSLGDAEQQADHQIAPEQPGELLDKLGRAASLGMRPSSTSRNGAARAEVVSGLDLL